MFPSKTLPALKYQDHILNNEHHDPNACDNLIYNKAMVEQQR